MYNHVDLLNQCQKLKAYYIKKVIVIVKLYLDRYGL